jgi:hypothetical protein
MQAIAPSGSIAITGQTRRLVEGFFQVKSLGPTRVKGLTEPINVYEVTGLGPLRTRLQRAAARGLTRFVGRDREMEALRHALEQAKAGHGQIVAAMAEPGVGKSRLFYEFKATSQYGCMVVEAYSVSHGKASSYVPVIELLQNYFGIVADDDPRQRRQKVIGKLLELDRSLEDVLPYLFVLLGLQEGDDPMARMDAQLRRRRTQEGLGRARRGKVAAFLRVQGGRAERLPHTGSVLSVARQGFRLSAGNRAAARLLPNYPRGRSVPAAPEGNRQGFGTRPIVGKHFAVSPLPAAGKIAMTRGGGGRGGRSRGGGDGAFDRRGRSGR